MFKFILSILKVLLAIILLPITIGISRTFFHHLIVYSDAFATTFVYGAVLFVFIFLFLYQFWGFFELGHKVLSNLLQFTSPLDKWLAYATPIFTILVLLIFYIVRVLIKDQSMDHQFSLLAGFTAAMHILVLAQELQNQEKTPIKPTYLFAINLIYIYNVLLIILLLDLVFQKWTFPGFLQACIQDVINGWDWLRKMVGLA